MNKTEIEWADYSWNPITGCKHGCEYCYAAAMARRFDRSFEPQFHPEKLEEINKIKKGIVFAGSNSDMFGDWLNPRPWNTGVNPNIRVLIAANNYYTVHGGKASIMFLTKNPEAYHKSHVLPIVENDKGIWLGTTLDPYHDATGWTEEVRRALVRIGGTGEEYSVETVHHDVPDVFSRLEWINALDYPRKFLSIEPIAPGGLWDRRFGSKLQLAGAKVQWVIMGFATRTKARYTGGDVENVIMLARQLKEKGIPVFIKNSVFDTVPVSSRHVIEALNEFRSFPAGVVLATKPAKWQAPAVIA